MPGWLQLTGRFQMSEQAAEKVRQLRSRLIEILIVPLRVRLRFRLACGLAGRTF